MRFQVSRVDIGRDILDAAASAPDVRDKVTSTGSDIMASARSLAAGSPDFLRSLRLVTGTRPGSRSRGGFRRFYATVSATSRDASAKEYGDIGVDKQAIMRRAAAGR